MSKFTFAIFIISFMFCAVAQGRERVVVVTHLANQSVSLSRGEIRNIFMGGVSESNLTAVEIASGSHIRIVFNTYVIGLPESRIQSYWAQMKFSGRNKPPISVDNVDEMISYLVENEASIGYLPEGVELPDSLTVILTTQ
ncbi:hypothetical protein R1T43_04220 [Alteromonas sp. CI.11.F.A3]|uniref:hypothetical protein n=1 Tax=Alteromonas sp. CI.11.F.A3 TaxID=3079555 RepID=UPI002943F4FE|nr:hypothetical protein [Alteromonas sp. CI.11.F.A3]WOI38251.1 hypothetical protein R1T43_04220 [Alteromonas sp. CI.11.F.A3]